MEFRCLTQKEGEVVSCSPHRVKPAYTTPNVGDTVTLFHGNVRLGFPPDDIDAVGSLKAEWSTRMRVRFEGTTSAPFKNNDAVRVQWPASLGRPHFDVELTSIKRSAGCTHIAGHLHSSAEIDRQVPLVSAIAHVTNFHDFLGETVQTGPSAEGAYRATCEFDGWELIVDRTCDNQLFDDIKRHNSMGITHTVRIQRVDEGVFSASDASRLLHNELNWPLAFCRGFWVGPVLGVGYDKDQNVCWQMFDQCRARPYEGVQSWFPKFERGALPELINGFATAWRDPSWKEVLNLGIYAYVAANYNQGMADFSLISIQPLFEAFAWKLLVVDGGMSEKQFRCTNAVENIREVLRYVGITNFSIPVELTSLTHYAKMLRDGEDLDGPAVLTRIRNGLVHPTKGKLARIPKDVCEYSEVHRLALVYAELAILKAANYNGKYCCSIRDEPCAEDVPWVSGRNQL